MIAPEEGPGLPELIVTDDGSHSLYLPGLKETYHSFHGALQESQHVFVKAGLEYFTMQSGKPAVKVLEVGFGTGLNTLLTADWASEKRLEVEMESIEAYPLPLTMVHKLNYPQLMNSTAAQSWFNNIHEAAWNKLTSIHAFFLLRKINNELESQELPSACYDVVFYDAFAPNKQAELWEKELLSRVHESQTPNGVFVTYCAKGQLKRDLKEIGYSVETLPGPPGKKEMVRATKS